jgi:inner membrane protein YhjD
MAYFSLLVLFPTLMIACAVLGFVITVLRPEWLDGVRGWLGEVVNDLGLTSQIMASLTGVLGDWRSLGAVALALGLYSGANWLGHLRRSLDAVARPPATPWRPDKKPGYFVGLLRDAGWFFVIAALILTTVTAALAADLGRAAGISSGLLRLAGPAASLVFGWVLFYAVLRGLPACRPPRRLARWGALLGTVGLWAFHAGASFILRAFARNTTAVMFGPAIVLLFVLNLIGQFVLFVAAWAATASGPPSDEASGDSEAADGPGAPDGPGASGGPAASDGSEAAGGPAARGNPVGGSA